MEVLHDGYADAHALGARLMLQVHKDDNGIIFELTVICSTGLVLLKWKGISEWSAKARLVLGVFFAEALLVWVHSTEHVDFSGHHGRMVWQYQDLQMMVCWQGRSERLTMSSWVLGFMTVLAPPILISTVGVTSGFPEI